MDLLDNFLEPQRVPAPAGRRMLMRIADGLLPLAALMLLRWGHWPLPVRIAVANANVLLLCLGLILFFRLLFIGITGGTFGMWLLRIELLSGEERPLNLKEKLLAACFVLYRGADYYLREPGPKP